MKEILIISNMENYFITKILTIFILLLIIILGVVITIASVPFGIFYFTLITVTTISFMSKYIERIEE